MKLVTVLLLTLLFENLYSQDFSEYVDTTYIPEMLEQVEEAIKNSSTFHEVIIIAVDYTDYSGSTLPLWFNEQMLQLPDFFNDATFGQFDYQLHILKNDANHAFIMPIAALPSFNGTCEHVHLLSNIIAVLEQTDNIYNFNDFDFDNDGIVDIHFTSIGG